MSRSFDSMSLTTRPSIEIVPPVISSSPASIRSSVDLPQPDGPTSTTNSPSRMSNPMPWMTFVLPKDFSMLWNATVAMVTSAFHRAGGQSADHVALERIVDRSGWQRVDEPGSHQKLPRRIVRRKKVSEGNGKRDVPVVRQQKERVQVFVPGEQQRVGADCDQRRRHQGKIDEPEELHRDRK